MTVCAYLAKADQCSDNFKNAIINNTTINEINIKCVNDKPKVPRFKGYIQHETFSEFVESGFENIVNFQDFISEHEQKIVYLDISPYDTCDNRAVSPENFYFAVPNYPELGSIYGGMEVNFSDTKGVNFDFNCMRLRLWGYYLIDAVSGTYSGGWVAAMLKPISSEKVYQIYGGEPQFEDKAKLIGTTFLQNMSTKDALGDMETLHEIHNQKTAFRSESLNNMGPFFLNNRCALVDANFSSFDEAKNYVINKMKNRLFANIYETIEGQYVVATSSIKIEYHDEKQGICLTQKKLVRQMLIDLSKPNDEPVITYSNFDRTNPPHATTFSMANQQKTSEQSDKTQQQKRKSPVTTESKPLSLLFSADKCALLVASRTNLLDAKLYLQQKVSDKRFANIYQVKNGRYAISIGLLNRNDKDSIIKRWKIEGKIPQDSFCANVDLLTKEIKF